MVKKWIKQLQIISQVSWIDFWKIIADILNGDYEKYDFKVLWWFKDLWRVRIGSYRIVFKLKPEIRILLVWKRWDVYKKLKQMMK